MTCRSKKIKGHKRDASVGLFAVVVVIFVFLITLACVVIADYVKGASTNPEDDVIITPPEKIEAEIEIEIIEEEKINPQAYAFAGNVSEVEREEAIFPDFIPLPVEMPIEDQLLVYETATDNGIDFCFVMAIIGHESEFTPDARSATGDSGYMQINDCNLDALEERGFVDMYDPAQNIGAGVSMLRDLFNTYGVENPHKVLMAYNMGASRAAELWAQGITSSEYSREIMELNAEYQRYVDAERGNE